MLRRIKILFIIILIGNLPQICFSRKVIHRLEVLHVTTGMSKTLASTINSEMDNINKKLGNEFTIHSSCCIKDIAFDSLDAIQNSICKLLRPQRRKSSIIITSAVLIINDNLDSKSNKIIQYFVNVLFSLGVPTITWLPSQIGQILVI